MLFAQVIETKLYRMENLERHLTAASGYLELGMLRDAKAELRLLDSTERKDWRVLALRVAICQEQGAWDRMLDIARYLACVQPDESHWAICSAHAMRRLYSVEAARDALLRAKRTFPQESAIPYHLACYEAELGDLEKARGYLQAAIRLNPALRAMARANPELAAVLRRNEEGKRQKAKGKRQNTDAETNPGVESEMGAEAQVEHGGS